MLRWGASRCEGKSFDQLDHEFMVNAEKCSRMMCLFISKGIDIGLDVVQFHLEWVNWYVEHKEIDVKILKSIGYHSSRPYKRKENVAPAELLLAKAVEYRNKLLKELENGND